MSNKEQMLNYDLVKDFPSSWKIVPLHEIVKNHDNKRFPIKSTDREKMRGVYPYCGANGVVDHINDYKFEGEYVLVAEDGGYWGKCENTSYMMRGKFFVNNHAHVLKAIEGKTTNYFLQLMLNYLDINPLIGGDARGKLTKTVLMNLPFPLPPLPTQKSIAKTLSTIQQSITAQEELITKLKDLKKSLMHHLFTHGTKNEKTKLTEIGEIPESWEVVELGSVCEKIIGGGTPSTKNSQYWNGNNPWITSKWLGEDLYLTSGEKFISDEAVSSSATHIIPSYSIIFATRVGVGKVSINNIDLAINQDLAAMIIYKGVNAEFLVYQLRSDRVQDYINSLKRGATIQGITREDLKKTKVVLPSLKEQEFIAKSLRDVDVKIDLQKKKLSNYQDFFQTTLHELMSGKNFNQESKNEI